MCQHCSCAEGTSIKKKKNSPFSCGPDTLLSKDDSKQNNKLHSVFDGMSNKEGNLGKTFWRRKTEGRESNCGGGMGWVGKLFVT
jgi:hypothetical protein